MLTRRQSLALAVGLPVSGCVSALPEHATSPTPAELRDAVRRAEEAFAATMARRDFAAFGALIAEDAVFINGGKPLRGKREILDDWKRFFAGPVAPFSWSPEIVELAGNGTLGYTEGNVIGANGKVTFRFYSMWQRGAAGAWSVVFDNGYAPCTPNNR